MADRDRHPDPERIIRALRAARPGSATVEEITRAALDGLEPDRDERAEALVKGLITIGRGLDRQG